MKKKVIISAYNVHQGGGAVLLTCLLESLLNIKNLEILLLLDTRYECPKDIPPFCKIKRIKPTILARLQAESYIKSIQNEYDTLFCFGNLPPLFSSQIKTFIYIQNKFIVGKNFICWLNLKTIIRTFVEKIIFEARKDKNYHYIVQTPSMKRSFLRRANAYDYQCSIFPFAPVIKVKDYQHENPSQEQVDNKKFIYVASGEPHKNHWNLLEGWLDLAKDGLKPKLTFVLDKSIYPKLHQSIEAFSQKNQLKVEIISHVPNRFMQNMYQEADALIYPSTFESFGLPLIEANAIGVPIIASELDFVRDVCQPAQTFNPHQPLSIARAVKRFLSFDGHTLIKAPQELIEYLVSN